MPCARVVNILFWLPLPTRNHTCSQVLFSLHDQLVAATDDPLSANRQRRVLDAIGLFATIASADLVAGFFGRLFKLLSESLPTLATDPTGATSHTALLWRGVCVGVWE